MTTEVELHDEALLQQALEALESSDWYIGQLEWLVYSPDDTEVHEERAKVQSAIAALRERLDWTPPDEHAQQSAAPSVRQTTGITDTALGYALKRATPDQVIEYLEDDINMHVALSLYFEGLHNQQPNAGLDVEAVLRQFLTGDGYIAECDIKHIVAALAQQPAAVAVDDAMVERACKAFLDEIWPDTYEDAYDLRAMIRRVLSAALVDQPQGDK